MISDSAQLIFAINNTKEENKEDQEKSGNRAVIEKDMTMFLKRIRYA